MRILLTSITLIAVQALIAQTQVLITNVHTLDNGQTLKGNEVTIQLNGAEGSERQVIFAGGDMEAKTWVKVSTHNVRRSSLKDSAVNLMFEIALKAGDDRDNKRVEKIFYLDQSRTSTVSQKFIFKHGIQVRVVTLSFDVEVK